MNNCGRGVSRRVLCCLIVLTSCVDYTAGHRGGADWQVEGAGIAVMGTDYLSSSVSILDPDTGALVAEGVIHSGSAAPGLSIALSGDVSFPQAPDPLHRLVLLDRYPNSVVTILDGEDFEVLGQVSVGTGFPSNPHDLIWIDPVHAWVSRYETNPDPGREAFDGGDDLVVVDLEVGGITGRISLADYADPGLQARPEQLLMARDRVWVVLGHLAADFKAAGPGRLVSLDPATEEVVQVLDLPGVENCTSLVHDPARDALYVACGGLWAEGSEGQLAGSGILRVDLAGDPPTAALLRRGDQGAPGPFGADLALAGGRWLVAVRVGDLASGTPDRLVALDLDQGGAETLVYQASSAHGMGGVLATRGQELVLVGEADPKAPRILRFRIDQGAFTPDGEILSHPERGLPPRQLAFY